MSPPEHLGLVGPTFSAPWEAQVFAMVVSLRERGLFSPSEWTQALAREIGPGGEAHYEAWLAALETLLIGVAVTDRAALAQLKTAWDEAARHTPHGQPIALARRS